MPTSPDRAAPPSTSDETLVLMARGDLSLLPEEDVATLRHLARSGLGANTLRAFASDLAYLEAWALAATGGALPWPATPALALKFIAHHLYDPAAKALDATHGMPDVIATALKASGALRAEGPHAVATVRRRLSLWAVMHRRRGLEPPFEAQAVREALRLAAKASLRPRQRKSARAVTRDVLDRLLATCAGGTLVDLRDAAVLLVAFASGGRRRSEVAQLRVEDLIEEPDVLADPADPASRRLPCLAIRLLRTKTDAAEDDARALLIGRPVTALNLWMARAEIAKGPVFRAIDRWQGVSASPLSPQGVNMIVKRRCTLAGLDPKLFSAHGLRSGFLTEAARQGVPLPEAMAQSRHRSLTQAARYYNDAERQLGKAARLAT
jgi:integrase